MLKVGLTGGIGSGKSTVSQVFEVLGIPVYYADQAAKDLMNRQGELMDAVKELFGAGIYQNNKLDRKKLAGIVFNDKEKLAALNGIVHPATIADGEKWMAAQNSPYAIKEAAILFESGTHTQLDKVIGVFAPEELRISRVMNRDKVSREEVLSRMEKQMNEEDKMKRCDFVILNNEHDSIIEQVLTLHQKLLQLAKNCWHRRG